MILLFLFILLSLVFLLRILFYIPSYKEHVERNKHNIMPKGSLKLMKEDLFQDDNGIIWRRRNFWQSLLHEPFHYYVFEEYNAKKQSSSEFVILKKDFDKGIKNYQEASYNYYSSFFSPTKHFFADVFPIVLYLAPNYKKFT